MNRTKRSNRRHLLVCGLATVMAACSGSQGTGGDKQAPTDIQALVDINSGGPYYIEIQVHRIADNGLVYDTGRQAVSPITTVGDPNIGRDLLHVVTDLDPDSNFVFEASLFNTADLTIAAVATATPVQQLTNGPGETTYVKLTIDLNTGSTTSPSPTDITAVTDNIPVLDDGFIADAPCVNDVDSGVDDPVLTSHLSFSATDLDANDPTTYFAAVIGNSADVTVVSPNADLFTLLPASGGLATFAFNMTSANEVVYVLYGALDTKNQLSYRIAAFDPTEATFSNVARGEGYGIYTPDGHHLAIGVFKNLDDSKVFAITRVNNTDTTVNSGNLQVWPNASVASLNAYENDDAGLEYLLRVEFDRPDLASGGDTTPIVDRIDYTFASTSATFATVAPNVFYSLDQELKTGDNLTTVTSVAVGSSSSSGGVLTISPSSGTFNQPVGQYYFSSVAGGEYPIGSLLETPAVYAPAASYGLAIPEYLPAGTYTLKTCSYGDVCSTATVTTP